MIKRLYESFAFRVAAIAVFLFAATGGLAYAGVFPSAIQEPVADVYGVVGFDFHDDVDDGAVDDVDEPEVDDVDDDDVVGVVNEVEDEDVDDDVVKEDETEVEDVDDDVVGVNEVEVDDVDDEAEVDDVEDEDEVEKATAGHSDETEVDDDVEHGGSDD